jgi:hypothetical protein
MGRRWIGVASVAAVLLVLAVPELVRPRAGGAAAEPAEGGTASVEGAPRPAAVAVRGEAKRPRPAKADFAVRTIDELLEALAAALRSKDLERTSAILDALLEKTVPPPIPDEENAAFVYLRAFDLLEAAPLSEAEKELVVTRIAKGEPFTAEELAAARELLAKAAPVLALLREGAALPGCRFPLYYEDGPAMRLDHIAPAILTAKLLRFEAFVRAQEGDAAGAAEDLGAALRLSAGVREDRLLISSMVGTVIDGIAFAGLQESALMADPALPSELQGTEPAATRELLRHALTMETVSFLSYAIKLTPEQLASMLELPDEQASFAEQGAADYVDRMREVVRLLERPYHEIRPRLEALDADAGQASVLTRLLFPAIERAASAQARQESQLTVLKLAGGLEQYRLAHGRYPDTLGTPPPLDPLTGLPFTYTVEGDRAVVASEAPEEPGRPRIEWRSTPTRP